MKSLIEPQHSFEFLLVMNDATTSFHFTTLIFRIFPFGDMEAYSLQGHAGITGQEGLSDGL